MLGDKRTTVTIGDMIVDLLSIKLNTTPGTKEAKNAVRHWFQSQLDEAENPGMDYVSRWLHDQTLKYLVEKDLIEKYWAWHSEVIYEKYKI